MSKTNWKLQISEIVNLALDKSIETFCVIEDPLFPTFQSPLIVSAGRLIKFTDDIICNLALHDVVRKEYVQWDVCVLLQSKLVEDFAQTLREVPAQRGVWPVTMRFLSYPDIENEYCANDWTSLRSEDKWTWVFRKDAKANWPLIAEHMTASIKLILLPELLALNSLGGIINYVRQNPSVKGLNWESYISALILENRYDLLRQEFSQVNEMEIERLTTFARNALSYLRNYAP